MSQTSIMLQQMSGQFAPMASGLAPTTMYGMENMPFVHNMGLMGLPAGQMMRNQMGAAGFANFGMHDVNVYDQMRDMQYTQQQMQAMSQAATMDRENFYRSFRGMAAMSGTQFGAQQRRAAYGMADMATYAAPVMAQMNPELLDQLGGLRGSATVMAHRMMAASRYRMDPVSGRMGMSADSVGALSRNVFDDFYNGDLRDMKGMTAGQVGSLYGELQNRGMIGGMGGNVRTHAHTALDQMQRTAPEQLQRAFSAQGVSPQGNLGKLSGEDLDKLMLDPSVAERMRSFDTEKIKRSLKAYSSAISAMKDIFGDMGRPNAPMQELMAGLEAFTAGSSAQMNPERMGLIARQTYNLAKQTGMSMDSAMMVQQHAASRAGQLGIEPVFAIGAAQGGMGFGGAYRSLGHAAHTAWGVFNADQMMQADVNLRVQAADSHTANRLGALMRAGEAGGGFKEGSEAASAFNAVRSGQGSFRNAAGVMQSTVMTDSAFLRLMKSGGIGEASVRNMLDQTETNREFVDRYGVGDIVRRQQGPAELHPFVQNRLSESLVSRLVEGGMNAKDARQSVGQIAGRATKRIFGMSTEDFAGNASRNEGIAGILDEELGGTVAGGFLGRMSAADRQSFLRTSADQFYGHANRSLGSSQYRGLGNLQNIHRLTNTETLAEADMQQQQAAFSARMQESMAALGRGTPLQRAMQFLQDAKPGAANFRDLAATAFGGVKAQDISDALIEPMQRVHKSQEDLRTLQASLGKTTDSEEKANIQKQIERAQRELSAQAAHLAKVGETYGMYKENAVTKEDTTRGVRSLREVADGVQDLASIRAGYTKVDTDVPLRASEAQVQAFIDKGHPEAQARWSADQEQRARRLGISESLITDIASGQMPDGTKGKPMSRAQAIHAAVQGHMVAQYEVSTADIEAYKKAHPNAPADPKAVEGLIMRERANAKYKRFDTFFASPDAARFSESINASDQYAADIGSKLVNSPSMIHRFGTQALDWHGELKAIAQRRDELAFLHTGGDRMQLEAGAYRLDEGTREGQLKALTITGEMDSLRQRQMDILQQIDGSHGKAGRQFRAGTREQGADLLFKEQGRFAKSQEQKEALENHYAWVQAGGTQVDDAAGNASFTWGGRHYNYTRKQYDEVYVPMRQQAQQEVGAEAEARRLLGFTADQKLSVEQEADLKRTKYAVDVMGRLTGDEAAKVGRFQDAEKSLDGITGRLGVNRKALERHIAGERMVDKLVVADRGEQAAHGAALRDHQAASGRFATASAQVQRLEAQIAATTDGPNKDKLKAQLADRVKARDAAKGEQDKAVNSIAESASLRGVTPAAYLFEKAGYVTQKELDQAGEQLKLFGDQRTGIEQLAKEKGLAGAGDFGDYKNLTSRYEALRKEAVKRETEPGADIMKELNRVYGLGMDDSTMLTDERVRRAASTLTGIEGRAQIQSLIGGHKYIQGVAGDAKVSIKAKLEKLVADGKGDSPEAVRLRGHLRGLEGGGNSGVDTVLKEYRRVRDMKGDTDESAAKKKAAMEQFQADFGMGGAGGKTAQEAYNVFSSRADMQLATRFAEVGAGRSLRTENLPDLLRNIQLGGEPGNKQGSSNYPTHWTGTFKYVGDNIDVNARTGGSTRSVPGN